MSETSLEILENKPRDRFAVGVAILAILATLVAASVGLLYAWASNAADRARSRAQDHALEAATAGTRADRRVEVALRAFELKRVEEARAALAHEELLLAEDRDKPWPLARDKARRRALAARADAIFERRVGERLSYEHDVNFPEHLRNEQQRPALVALALRDAENEVAAAWDKRGGTYAAILTLLTVALYLLGFALTPQAVELRGLFAAVGTSFLALGVLFGPIHALATQPEASRTAANAFADGTVAFMNASAQQDYIDAQRAFDRAIRARPSFAAAYLARSDAEFLAGSPQFAVAPSLTTPTARRQAINDLRMAAGLGLESPRVLNDLGFELIAAGLEEGRPPLRDEGMAVTERAIDEYAKSDPRDRSDLPGGRCRPFVEERRDPEPIPLFNLAAATLASNRPDEARGQYEHAICAAVADKTLLALTSGALTDLELVARHGDLSIQDDVLRMKELVVASSEAEKLRHPAPPQRALRGVRIFIEAGHVAFTVAAVDAAKAGPLTSISAHWYYLDRSRAGRDGLGWSHAADISGDIFLTPLGDGSHYASTNYIGTTREHCLPSGRYRLELYDQGRLIGQAEAEYDQGARRVAFHDPVSGVVGCRPASWSAHRTPLGIRYASDDRKRGVEVLRLDSVSPRLDVWQTRTARRLLSQVIGTQSRRFARLRYVGPDAYSFMELGAHRFAYGGGRILAGLAPDSDGSVLVAFVHGPRTDFETESDRPAHLVGSPDAVETFTSLARADYTAAGMEP